MSENKAGQPEEIQELSEILRIRREKLGGLQEEGRDPFQKTRFDRTTWIYTF